MLRQFMTDLVSVLDKKPFKPALTGADPVPAARSVDNLPGWRPGSGAPDPVPAISGYVPEED